MKQFNYMSLNIYSIFIKIQINVLTKYDTC